ncbi:hypothetical protein EPN15_00575 [Patescibacteria group bacterium]|nr:MAG: hypothetical protein EPN15_00575 [Patescibacteria group bacterium]
MEGFEGNKIRYMGSSVAKSAPCDDEVNSVAFSLKEGDKGFIAIRAFIIRPKSTDAFSFFLPVEWRGDMPFVDLESLWIPPFSDRLGALNYFGLMVEIDGIIYTTNLFDKDKEGKRYISNCNLLCKYLAGDVDADAVKSAATELIEEEEAKKRILELEERIKDLNKLLSEKDQIIYKKDKLMEDYRGRADKIIDAAETLYIDVNQQWFHRPAVKKALKDIDRAFIE